MPSSVTKDTSLSENMIDVVEDALDMEENELLTESLLPIRE